jgi:hypothetical protein
VEKNEQQPLNVEELLSELSIKVERVKQLYEQYFMGIEKLEPQVARKEVQRTMLMLQQQYIRNTGLRFKFNTLLQKWNIYITYWNRVLREIENGTYTRHLAKAQRSAARDGKALPEELMRAQKQRPPSGTFDTGVGANVERGFLDVDSEANVVGQRPVAAAAPKTAVPPSPASPPTVHSGARPMPPPIPGSKPAAPPVPPAARAPAPAARAAVPRPSAAIPGMSEPELRQLHEKYVAARKQSGENSNVAYETLVNSLAKQVPGVLQQPGVKSVRFDVTVQNGKAVLKAIPQKK